MIQIDLMLEKQHEMAPIQRTMRLLTFNAYDAHERVPGDDQGIDTFTMQMFGINESGETFCLFVEGFQPFFWVRVDERWGEGERLGFKSHLEEHLGARMEGAVTQCKYHYRKKLYGFDGESYHKFMVVKFRSVRAMNKAKNLWYETFRGNRKLKRNGYFYEGAQSHLELYEANIPPLLRYFHIQEISPSGWVAIPSKSAKLHTRKTTTCKYEYTVQYNKLIPLPDKETRVPYKICSFDIEASSSHGDFPLPKKNYKKLAADIVDKCLRVQREGGEVDAETLTSMIMAAFGFGVDGDINIVYPKRPVVEGTTRRNVIRWLNMGPTLTKEEEPDAGVRLFQWNDAEQGDDSGGETPARRGKKRKVISEEETILSLLSHPDAFDREELIGESSQTLSACFPPLHGDKTTFIGSTFLRYGDEKPYLNHCVVLDTCDRLPQVEHSVIETCGSEKALLYAWAKLIREEDPDIIIGYNIFGFDYQFLFQRAQELSCVEEFLQMSRNKGERCYTKDYRTGRVRIEESSVILASGPHDLRYIMMQGRLQVDMYNYLRRDYSLTSYKLDHVAGNFIGDTVKRLEHMDGNTVLHTKNLVGLDVGAWISLEEIAHSSDSYQDGKKMEVMNIDHIAKTFTIRGVESPNMDKKVKWGLAKDDVSPQDIFRMTNEGPSARATIAKYCIQDCNLVHQLLRKIDVITGFIEMSKLCSVPMSFLVLRGQGIKLTSYVAKKCREKHTLLPVVEKTMSNEGYEGAIVLEPKTGLYTKKPVWCVDYSSLYPSSMISENVSHDSKVWTREYNLDGHLIKETGEKGPDGSYKYDNLPNYRYVNVEYDTYKYTRKSSNAAAVKTLCGKKMCRFAQFPQGRAVMPSILEELLAARKATRKLIPQQEDEFMKNVLDKRQLSIKVTANSLYGQTGAKTSSFYEVDVAASTTATGRKLLKYAERMIEEVYGNTEVDVEGYGRVRTRAERVYGDTDSVFATFNFEELDGTPIEGQRALEMTIVLAQEAGKLASMFLKKPHDLEYEKTFLAFLLLSKKRYVGMLYELDPHSCYRKEMGIVLKRRDNAPIVKDVYGGIIDILMKENDVTKAVTFLKNSLQNLVDGNCPMEKLIVTKSLRGHYKNPAQIAHKVLADRMGRRDPGNKPASGDRIPYAYVQVEGKGLKQGEKIEHPEYIRQKGLKLDYSFYISNQIMKPVQQVFAQVLPELAGYDVRRRSRVEDALETLRSTLEDEAYRKKEMDVKCKEVKSLLFDDYLRQSDNARAGQSTIRGFFGARVC